ncbi:TetR/AcrR family transcriptional regulator [Solicola gregarius]|uniref:TetR family transcriptional regulator n=1 Tax=Solicola gregarius TaxID=2908642 RepID=A0AA46TFS5_9ACTN|nr:TetR family transcriptional regulator [Solicola gregarius]UYM04007.1 TetR family transcriptional regulator [Solicola gregarius]
MTSPHPERPVGLRERKKARTRDAIQREALRLFTEQGYDATTVEQIAEAAEVSPSTYFRYFPTKEEPVIYDRIDPILMASFLDQPAELTPLQAVRVAIREVLQQLPAEESELEAMRHRLIFGVPELRARIVERMVDTMSVLADAVAERVGCERGDERVQVFTGCVLGAMLAGAYGRDGSDLTEPPPMLTSEMVARVDRALKLLENGVPFERADG